MALVLAHTLWSCWYHSVVRLLRQISAWGMLKLPVSSVDSTDHALHASMPQCRVRSSPMASFSGASAHGACRLNRPSNI